MIPGASASPYFLYNQQVFHALDGMESTAAAFMPIGAGNGGGEQVTSTVSDTHCHALLYHLSVLKDKVQQLQPLVGCAVAHDGPGPVAVSGAGAVIQDIIAAASSMMYAFQQLSLGPVAPTASAAFTAGAEHDDISDATVHHHRHDHYAKNSITTSYTHKGPSQGTGSEVIDHGFDQRYNHKTARPALAGSTASPAQAMVAGKDVIIELDAVELLAKYTHYCQVCGKGFKRDANLRMHMRAHGDEYKTNAALANPTRANGEDRTDMSVSAPAAGRKYSCPHEGCRWNKKHAKFQPLKSVICVKNHYKRSHCPKMYVCNRCNRKHFSVLSDLRTHEKHCGDHRWLCSCGTTFSRKDKLMGHVALFAGHAPAVPIDCFTKQGKREQGTGNGNGRGIGIGMT